MRFEAALCVGKHTRLRNPLREPLSTPSGCAWIVSGRGSRHAYFGNRGAERRARWLVRFSGRKLPKTLAPRWLGCPGNRCWSAWGHLLTRRRRGKPKSGPTIPVTARPSPADQSHTETSLGLSRRFCQTNVVMSGGAASVVNYQGPTGGLITAGEQCHTLSMRGLNPIAG
jgi:hypothetical protein